MTKDASPLRVFKNSWFNRFAKREKISDTALKKAIAEAERGIVAADLGGNVIKQRIARTGQGKSGGYRAIVIIKKRDKAFFVYGFAKSEKENIEKDELTAFKKTGKVLLSLSDEQIKKLIETGAQIEIKP